MNLATQLSFSMFKLVGILMILCLLTAAPTKGEDNMVKSRKDQLKQMRLEMKQKIKRHMQRLDCTDTQNIDSSKNHINICQSNGNNSISVQQSDDAISDGLKDSTNKLPCSEKQDSDGNLHISCKGRSGSVNIKQQGNGSITIIQNGEVIIDRKPQSQ